MSKAEFRRDLTATFPRFLADRPTGSYSGPEVRLGRSCSHISIPERFRVDDGATHSVKSLAAIPSPPASSAQIGIGRFFEVEFCPALCVIGNER